VENFKQQPHIEDEVAIGLAPALLRQVLDQLFEDDVGHCLLFAQVLHEDEAEHEVKVEAVRMQQLEVGLIEEFLQRRAIEVGLLLGL
jgi:hypothetical protein